VSGTLLDRYVAGQRTQVWLDLAQLGARVREPEHLAEAVPVVREAMTRARDNVVTLIERLHEQGYAFHGGAPLVPHAPPDEHTPAFVTWLEARWGPLPLTLRAWIEVVGDVSLLGNHPAFPTGLVTDPLVIEVEYKGWREARVDRTGWARAYHESEYEAWLDRQPGEGEPFAIVLAPDDLHKAEISGGPPYGIYVPDASADGRLRYADGVQLSFIEYLRLVFANGGFPGLWKRDPGSEGRRACRRLAEGLLPL